MFALSHTLFRIGFASNQTKSFLDSQIDYATLWAQILTPFTKPKNSVFAEIALRNLF